VRTRLLVDAIKIPAKITIERGIGRSRSFSAVRKDVKARRSSLLVVNVVETVQEQLQL
jgi:hypothetical protein